jgi:hypothetical protein
LESIFTFKFQNKESKPKKINLLQDKFLIFFDDNTFIYIINANKTFELFKGNLENFRNSENSLISLTNISSDKYLIIIKDKKASIKAIILNPKINKSSEVKFENESVISDIIVENDSNNGNLFYVVRKSGSKNEYTIETFFFINDSENNNNDFKSLNIRNVHLFNNDNIKSIKGKFDNKFTSGNLLILTNFNHFKNIQIENEVKKYKKIYRNIYKNLLLLILFLQFLLIFS